MTKRKKSNFGGKLAHPYIQSTGYNYQENTQYTHTMRNQHTQIFLPNNNSLFISNIVDQAFNLEFARLHRTTPEVNYPKK